MRAIKRWNVAWGLAVSLAGVPARGQVSEPFDSTPVSGLPAGWSSSVTGAGNPWRIVASTSHSAPHCVYTNDAPSLSSQFLNLPPITAQGLVVLGFFATYSTEECCDGLTVEVSINGDGFRNVAELAGSAWLLNPYTTVILNGDSPIAGQRAFAGSVPNAFTEHRLLLPALPGDTVRVRFRMSSDSSAGSSGAWLDDITLGPVPVPAQFTSGVVNLDFDAPGGATQSGQGVLESAGGFWNSLTAGAGSRNTAILFDSTGQATPVSVGYTGASGGYNAGTATSFSNTTLAALMADYLFVVNGSTATITLSGLSPGAEYDLVLFSNPDGGVARTSRFVVGGVAQTAASNGVESTLVRGHNFVRFERTRASGTGQVQVVVSSPNGTEADINGLQIQALAAPSAGACCQGAACTTTTSADCPGTFLGLGVACAPTGRAGAMNACCRADFNASGVISVQDIFDFLAAYFGGC
jgi:hypothetical protein